MKRLAAIGCLALGFGLLAPAEASAGCGFYVGTSDARLSNDSTIVVLMREGSRTVVSIQNNYRGPPEEFALVIPVPVVPQHGDVVTLRSELFDRVETLASPRLVEYWETDPCPREVASFEQGNLGVIRVGNSGAWSARDIDVGTHVREVKTEAEFVVGEYDILILSATASSELEQWLRDNDYAIPEGAERLLRPHVQQGMKFLVARVDPKKVEFDARGEAKLSPLRFHYDSEDFVLPVRLGLINAPADAKQDLLIHILARKTRYEVGNYPNVTIPTNLDVKEGTKENFGEFYVSLFDHTLAQNPGAVVTEYARSVDDCDPCPSFDALLTGQELLELGADVLQEALSIRPNSPADVRQLKPTVTGDLDEDLVRRIVRAHLDDVRSCYARGLADHDMLSGRVIVDFTIAKTGKVVSAKVAETTLADASVGECVVEATREWVFPKPRDRKSVKVSYPFELGAHTDPSRMVVADDFVLTRLHARYDAASLDEDFVFAPAVPLDQGGTAAGVNKFQAHYAIRHEWTEAIECAKPIRGQWDRPRRGPVEVATQLTEVARGASLAGFVDAETLDRLGVVPESAEPGIEEITSPAPSCACSSDAEPKVPAIMLALLVLLGLRLPARSKRRQ